jgi:excisionase family DNA binding protein
MNTQTETLFDKREAAHKLRCCVRTLDYRLKRGQIPFVKLGKNVRFIPADIEAYIQAHRIGG